MIYAQIRYNLDLQISEDTHIQTIQLRKNTFNTKQPQGQVYWNMKVCGL